MKIVFMGTPDFAVPSLNALLENGYDVVCVVTQPDRPKGRGKKLMPSVVKQCALKHGLGIMQPEKIKEQECVNRLKMLHPDLFVTCAFGQILSKDVLDIPKYGCINLHASLLPKYRGAGPIQWAIINGEKKTGITTMMTNEGLDTGDILLKEEMEIGENMTAGELHDKMSVLGAEVLIRTIKSIEEDNLARIPQDHSSATYAPMIKKDMGEINWEWSASRIHNLIRGLNPWPGAFTFYKGLRLKVWRSKVFDKDKKGSEIPGTILEFCGMGMLVQTGKGVLLVEEIQCDNSKKMTVRQYICGHKMHVGEKLGEQ